LTLLKLILILDNYICIFFSKLRPYWNCDISL